MPFLHYVLHGSRGRLWKDDAEAAGLWRALTGAFPEPLALCLMPSHVHVVLPTGDHTRPLARAMSGYARFRNHRRGAAGPVFAASDPPSIVADDRHLRRTVRYLALNPCRDGLASCPLGWRWSTHRDQCGLTWPQVGRLHARPVEWHKYVSSDHDTTPAGTPFPTRVNRFVEIEEIVATVASVLRDPAVDITRRGPARAAFVGCALALGRAPSEVARHTGLQPRRLFQIAADEPDPVAALCVRVAGDPRFC